MSSLVISAAGPDERATIVALLVAAGLPATDLEPVDLHVARDDGQIVGAIGLERHAQAGLLRSLVVEPDKRGCGIGSRLVEHLEAVAVAAGLTELVLLTETASDFFMRRGYRSIERVQAPAGVRDSEEFRSLCPASAVCMSRLLDADVVE